MPNTCLLRIGYADANAFSSVSRLLAGSTGSDSAGATDKTEVSHSQCSTFSDLTQPVLQTVLFGVGPRALLFAAPQMQIFTDALAEQVAVLSRFDGEAKVELPERDHSARVSHGRASGLMHTNALLHSVEKRLWQIQLTVRHDALVGAS